MQDFYSCTSTFFMSSHYRYYVSGLRLDEQSIILPKLFLAVVLPLGLNAGQSKKQVNLHSITY